MITIKQIKVGGKKYDIQATYDDLGRRFSETYMLSSSTIITGNYVDGEFRLPSGENAELKPGVVYLDASTLIQYLLIDNKLVGESDGNSWIDVL